MGNECRILDVTITADVFDMEKAYLQKITFYRNEDVLRWAEAKWLGYLLSVDAVVMNWHGAIYFAICTTTA